MSRVPESSTNAQNPDNNKIVVVVRRGMVDAVYCSKAFSVSETEILDFDATVPNEIRRNKIREKKAKEMLKQIY